MLPFYATGKEIELPVSKKRMIVKRPGVGYYFRFLFLLMEVNELNQELVKARSIDDPKELYLKLFEINLKLKAKNKQFDMMIRPLIDREWKKVDKRDKDFVIKEALEFNRYRKGTGDRELKKEDFEKELEFILYFFCERGYTLEKAAEEITYYQACAMMEQYKMERITRMHDTRIATQASGDDYKKILHQMQGRKIIEDPEELRRLADG